MTSREILDIKQLPGSLAVIGGGVIGLEMACYFATVGVKVTVIEMLDRIAGNTDIDISSALMKILSERRNGILPVKQGDFNRKRQRDV